jgi:hypothetical protein
MNGVDPAEMFALQTFRHALLPGERQQMRKHRGLRVQGGQKRSWLKQP